MKRSIKYAFFLIAVFAFTSCKKGITDIMVTNLPVPDITLPIANAGVDQQIWLPADSIVLSGSALGTNGVLSYRWHLLNGPLPVKIIDTNAAITKVKNLVAGIYEFELQVSDKRGFSVRDSIIIMVSINKALIANAGPDRVIQIFSCYNRSAIAELDGTGSSVPGNTIVQYKWFGLYGPQGYILKNSGSPKTSLEKLSPGAYAFVLSVTDLGSLSSRDTVLITVIGSYGIPKEYDLDLTVSAGFSILNNYNNPWEDSPDFFYDETYMHGIGDFPPLGEFNVGLFEFADSAAHSNILYSSSLQIRTTNTQSYLYLDGHLL
jgi:hypothetical protein